MEKTVDLIENVVVRKVPYSSAVDYFKSNRDDEAVIYDQDEPDKEFYIQRRTACPIPICNVEEIRKPDGETERVEKIRYVAFTEAVEECIQVPVKLLQEEVKKASVREANALEKVIKWRLHADELELTLAANGSMTLWERLKFLFTGKLPFSVEKTTDDILMEIFDEEAKRNLS